MHFQLPTVYPPTNSSLPHTGIDDLRRISLQGDGIRGSNTDSPLKPTLSDTESGRERVDNKELSEELLMVWRLMQLYYVAENSTFLGTYVLVLTLHMSFFIDIQSLINI